ncbi:MAG: flagellar hook-length control protein FliK [Oscillospiraceae bacterium]|nr:flagellar hook-length control protein FliK [Oscillospiraceae bacterium]
MNVAENLLFQQMQTMTNLPQTGNAGKKDLSGSFQDLMDQAGQNTAVDSAKTENTPAEQQRPVKKDAAEQTTNDTKPAQKDVETGEAEEIDLNVAVYALDLFRPEIVDVSEPEAVTEMPVEIAVPVEEAPVDVQAVPAAEESAPEIVTDSAPVQEAAPVEKAPEIHTDTPVAEAVQEEARPAAEVELKPVEHVEVEVTVEKKDVSDTGEVRTVQTEEKSEDSTSEDLSGEIAQMNQPVFHDVKAAPVKVADNYQPVDTQDPEMDSKLANSILQAVQQGTEQMQIRLNPANLGAVVIDLAKDASGALQVVIHASNSKAAGLLNEHLDSLHTALQAHGSEQEVRVEVQRNQEGQEQHMFQHADPDGKGQHQRRQEERKQQQEESGEDFMQKLRLGLTGVE